MCFFRKFFFVTFSSRLQFQCYLFNGMNENLKVLAWDGFPLSAAHFIPVTSNGKTMLIINGIGENQNKYGDFAQYFADEGYHVYTFDFRGIGKSRPSDMRSLNCDLKDWAALDLDAMISYIISAHPQGKFILAAHGMGGTLLGLSRLSRKADAFVMIGCQSPHYKNLKGVWTKLRYQVLSTIVVPLSNMLFGYFPASAFRLSDDLPRNAVRELIQWTRSSKGVLGTDPELRNNFASFDQSTLSISFSDDTIATERAVNQLFEHYSGLRVERWHFTPEQVVQVKVGHFGFFRKQMKNLVWTEINNWISQRVSTSRTKAA
jgi:predicted alpha/beta hydrolase